MLNQQRNLRKLDDEEWAEIPGTNGTYTISNYGRVKSYALEKNNGQFLKTHMEKQYLAINLRRHNIKSRLIHRLVAEAWLPKPSEEHNYVIHKDWNMRNNHVSNLEWVKKEDVANRSSQYMKKKNANPDKLKLITYSKLKLEDVKVIKSMLSRGITQNIIAKMFRISEMQVTRIKRGENWGYVTQENPTTVVNS